VSKEEKSLGFSGVSQEEQSLDQSMEISLENVSFFYPNRLVLGLGLVTYPAI
jgi:hypothetical protein